MVVLELLSLLWSLSQDVVISKLVLIGRFKKASNSAAQQPEHLTRPPTYLCCPIIHIGMNALFPQNWNLGHRQDVSHNYHNPTQSWSWLLKYSKLEYLGGISGWYHCSSPHKVWITHARATWISGIKVWMNVIKLQVNLASTISNSRPGSLAVLLLRFQIEVFGLEVGSSTKFLILLLQ